MSGPHPDMQKLSMADAWSSSAEAYVHNMQTAEEGEARLEMSEGRNAVVTRVVKALANKEKPVILDVAAAGGEPALTMAKEMPHATVHGTDFAPKMVDFIRKRGEEAGVSNLKASVEDGQQLAGFEDESVDAVTCTWGLASMPDRQNALKQFHRVLKKDGVAVIAVWDRDPRSIAMSMFKAVCTLKGSDPEALDIQPLGGGAGPEAMGEAGFVDVTAEQMPIPMYLPDGQGLLELFPYMVRPTPVDGTLKAMEAEGRPYVRQEASEIFKTQVMNDIKEGRPPTGPGLPLEGQSSEGKPVFEMKALILEGRKRG